MIKPNTCPIYNQHIHSAINFMTDKDYHDITASISGKRKEKFYFDVYLPFLRNNDIANLRDLDKAFFAFGRFLKLYPRVFSSNMM